MKSSRRRFLQSALGAPLAARIGGFGLSGVDSFAVLSRALGGAGDQTLFDNPKIVRYDSSCFTLRDHDVFIYSGSFHYPRCPKILWRDRLLKLKQAGYNTVETYAFWNYHEPEEGRADLGEFEEFIKLVKEMGLWMIARPGPYVCAEWDAGGFPHWLMARRVPLRSNHPENVKASQHWFGLVLPIIQRHQVLVGGPIIMMQIENEFDYWNLPSAEKQEYLRALARMAWGAGISIPLITCWTRQARNRADPDMARLMDTCNFYPRWNVVKEVVPAFIKLRVEEPVSPLGVTELQGGWYSEFGGKLSAEQDGISAAQLNLLTKTVIEQGATYFNHYMAFGGTNFDWAAKGLTTSYDYAAPLREPGGLGEKYYAARQIGTSLNLLSPILVRARRAEDATTSSNPAVSVSERVNEKSAVVFVRENSNAAQRFKMSFRDPNSPTGRIISAPRDGELELAPREMKMLPVQLPIPGSQLRYSTAEVCAFGLCLDRHYLILADEPGRLVEFGLATENEPRVDGEALYQYWDPEYLSVVLGLRVEKDEKILLVNDHLLVILIPRQRALRTFAAEFSSKVVLGAEETKPMSVPFLADMAQLAASGTAKKGIWAELDFLPGEHDLTVFLPPQPSKCRVDGAPHDFQYERPLRRARLHLSTPPVPVSPVEINEVEYWIERFDPGAGEWLKSSARPLEELGGIPYGYVKYRAEFLFSGQAKMFVATFSDDGKKVFLNGKLVREVSNSKKLGEFPLSSYAKAGPNLLEIACEVFGSPSFGGNIAELKGLEFARLGSDAAHAAAIDAWQIQRFAVPARGRAIDSAIPAGGWSAASLRENAAAQELVPAFAWCRAAFTLPQLAGWTVPRRLTFEADRDALLYLNGKFAGRYVTAGPQKDFYLPEPFLISDAKKKNILTVVLAYAAEPHHIRTLRISPYQEFATRRTRVEFEW